MENLFGVELQPKLGKFEISLIEIRKKSCGDINGQYCIWQEEVGLYLNIHPINSGKKPFYKTHPIGQEFRK